MALTDEQKLDRLRELREEIERIRRERDEELPMFLRQQAT